MLDDLRKRLKENLDNTKEVMAELPKAARSDDGEDLGWAREIMEVCLPDLEKDFLGMESEFMAALPDSLTVDERFAQWNNFVDEVENPPHFPSFTEKLTPC